MRFIPNEESWIGFIAALSIGSTMAAPKLADITGAVDLTSCVTGITASTSGNAVSTPSFDTRFETSIPGTVQASFSIDGYRYTVDTEDLLWTTLPRDTQGYVFIARHGGKPTTAGKKVEVWNIDVLSRSVPQMTSNTAVTCTVQCSCPSVPQEDAVIAA